MVTGAYYPEPSGGGVQCRNLVLALRDSVRFGVLTTARVPLPRCGYVDEVPVWRIVLADSKFRHRLRAFAVLLIAYLCGSAGARILHLHGFTLKSVLGVFVAKLSGKRVLLTIHTAGQDEPQAQRRLRLGRLRLLAYRAIDRYVAVSPALSSRFLTSGLPRERLVQIPNGVDVSRFRPPVATTEKAALRAHLELPETLPVILYVGFFSWDKGPHLAVKAWLRIREKGIRCFLVMVGSTDTGYFEIDGDLVNTVRRLVASPEAGGDARLVERTVEMENYCRAADVFVLPSLREGLPMVLLEAMATGLPCVASRLPGATDVLIEDGVDGILIPPGDEESLAAALAEILENPARGEQFGRRARAKVESRHTLDRMAEAYLNCYRELA